MRTYIVFLTIVLLLAIGCQKANQELMLKTGIWRMSMNLGEEILPFQFELQRNDSNVYHAVIINGYERIQVKEVTVKGDSITIRPPMFDSEFKGKIISSTLIQGDWYNYAKADDYTIPFEATHGEGARFELSAHPNPVKIDGEWKVLFSPDTDDQYVSIGQFQQEEERVTGTFLTETGDYRFLEGNVDGNELKLSCFDGSHAFLFKAKLDGEQLQGYFWSGSHWKEPWVGVKEEGFRLTDPDSLTFLKEGYDKLSFSFPDLNGKMVSLDDPKYQGKAVIVQVLGSWCPNCMDETSLFGELYRDYNTQGLEVIGLAYERTREFERAVDRVNRMRTYLKADYDFLIAGYANKKEAAESLPMLNHIISYPTSIFIDRKGKIRKIHTGFYGPGTGKYYEEFVLNTRALIEDMLTEK